VRLSGDPTDPTDGKNLEQLYDAPILFEASLNEIRNGNVADALTTLGKTYDAVAQELEDHEAQRNTQKRSDETSLKSDADAIRAAILKGNFEEAAVLANLALLAFPGDSELTELESEIQTKREEEFRRLVSEAEQQVNQGQWALAIQTYQAARELDPNNKLPRVQMAKTYAAWARDLLPLDRKAAEKLVETSLSLDAYNPEVRELHLTLLQEVTKELVDRALHKARELRAKGEMLDPEKEVRNALQKISKDPTLPDLRESDASKDANNASLLAPQNNQDTGVREQFNDDRAPNLDPSFAQQVTGSGKFDFAQTAIPIQVGQVLNDRYEILAHLGGGGMSTVYKTRDVLVDQTIALKVVLPSISGDPRLCEKFKKELLVARRLTHPNVVRIYDIGEYQGLLFISMELIEGQTVAQILEERKFFTVDQFLTLFGQFTSALAYIHSQHILHRDIKPHNLMFDKHEVLKVMDFGIARDMASDQTTLALMMGTPAYMSPELLEGSPLTPASDIYSAGAMFYELLTGSRLFEGSLHERLNMKVPRVSEVVRNIPRDLDEMICRCLQLRPEDRFRSVEEMVAAIGALSRPRAPEEHGTLADLIGDDPPLLIDALPIFLRIVQQLAIIHKNESAFPILTPKMIECGRTGVQIRTVSAGEAQHTRAVDCKYGSFEDFSGLTLRGGQRQASDIYVVGFIFYEILLGQRLFRSQFSEQYKGDSNFQWLHWHSDPKKTARPLKEIVTDIPANLSDTIENMMQKAIERRPNLATVEASLKAVLEYLTREVMQTVVLRREPQAPKGEGSEKKMEAAKHTVFVAVLLVLAAITILAVWLAFRNG
jgi:serine/threonine protein kinase/tetratricopeptide (TPR) repeat protein